MREQAYRAYISRATSGSTDNQPIVERIFAVRRAEAQLLNYSSYTDYALADRVRFTVPHNNDWLLSSAPLRQCVEYPALHRAANAACAQDVVMYTLY